MDEIGKNRHDRFELFLEKSRFVRNRLEPFETVPGFGPFLQ